MPHDKFVTEEDVAGTTDPKEKKRIQNRVAQRVHREKLKSRIRQLEEQLENVSGASTQKDTSKVLSSYDDPASSFAIAGFLPTTTSEPVSERLGTSSRDITFGGHHNSKTLMGPDTAVDLGFNGIPQTSIVAQLDCLSRAPAEAHSMDLEWLLTDSGAIRTVQERTQVHSPSMERGHKDLDHSQSQSNIPLPRYTGSSEYVRIGGDSGQSTHKVTAVPLAQNTGHEPSPRPDVTRLERLGLLVEYSRRLGFSNLDEALSVYYTSDLSKSAILCHEQSLNRVRQLPNFLSDLREHSKHWPTWERAHYVRETLRSAEDLYAEECRLARTNLRDQATTGLTHDESQLDHMFQITRVLQQEVCYAYLASFIEQTLTHHFRVRFQIHGP